jgi:hypothetical protein
MPGAGSSLSVEDATHEHLDVRCGKHNQARKRTARRSVSIEGIGNGQVKRPHRPGDNAFPAPPGAESG